MTRSRGCWDEVLIALLSWSPKPSGVGPKTYMNLMWQTPHSETCRMHWEVRGEGSQEG